jgi:hypothetical protein
MGKAGEFGVCLGDLKKVEYAIEILKLYFSAHEQQQKVGVMKKEKGLYTGAVKSSILGK